MTNRWDIRWKDYYQILQVHPTAGQEVIKAAYDRLARVYHPDVNHESSSTQKMADINEAFEVLGILETRRLYHPEWLRRRNESNSYRAPPRTSTAYETYAPPQTAGHIIYSKPRIPNWGKWVIGLAGGWFLLAVVIPSFTSSPTPSPTTTLPPSTYTLRTYNSLPTGTYVMKNMSGGKGELEISNGLAIDSVAIVSSITAPKNPLIAVYIKAKTSYTITGVRDGVYGLYFSCGGDWWTQRLETEPFTAQELSHSLKSGKLLENQWIPEERSDTNGQGLCNTPQGDGGGQKYPFRCS